MNARTVCRALVAGLLLTTAALKAAEPPTAEPDWVYYATVDTAGAKQDLFFLRSDIKTTADGHLRVWTKGLPDRQLSRVKMTEDQMRRAVVRTIAKPSSIPGTTTEEQTGIAAYEVLAGDGKIDPQMRILWELDCADEMMRPLSMYITQGGKHHDSNTTGSWMHSPPESIMATLMTMACPKR